MTESAQVVIVTRFTPEAVDKIRQLTAAAVERAIWRAKDIIATKAMTISGNMTDFNVPVATGRLAKSFQISHTPRHLAMKWSAIDPRTGFDYALVQDVGRANMMGRFYSEITKFYAHQILMECLMEELRAVGS